MTYILTNNRVIESAKLIQQTLYESAGILLALKTELILDDPFAIRWGNSNYRGYGGPENVFNSADSIRLAGNKLRLSEYLQDKEFPHVEIFEGVPDHFPVVVRKELNRGGGIGIHICKTFDEFEAYWENYPWSYWRNFQSEFGVHMLGGKVVKAFRKVWDKEDELESEFPIKNTSKGYRYSLVDFSKKSKLLKYCSSFYETLPINMCRLDIGWNAEKKIYELIEVNSAPDLTKNANTLDLYVKYIAENLKKGD